MNKITVFVVILVKKLSMLIVRLCMKNVNHKASKFKHVDRVRITKHYNKGYTEKWSKEIFAIGSLIKTNPWTYKVKDLNGEKLTGNLYE